jgi:hypothetical protein
MSRWTTAAFGVRLEALDLVVALYRCHSSTPAVAAAGVFSYQQGLILPRSSSLPRAYGADDVVYQSPIFD